MNPYAPRPIDRPTQVPLDPTADLSVLDESKILAAPDDPALWPRWREQLHRWRADAAQRIRYDGSRYDAEPDGPFVVDVVWLWDELLYDRDGVAFTVDRYLATVRREFGGVDGVLLWHAYPLIGIDGRDQFAYYHDVPELPDVVSQLQETGVRVYVAVYPWESAPPDTVADLVTWSGADGIFLDSSKEGSAEIRDALDAVRPGLSMGGESRVPLARIHDHTMSWAQWFADSDVPGVLRAKWFERRHMLHQVRRWHRSHVDELHSAWLNGSGVLLWENVFGSWVGWNARDKSLLRAMRRVHREFSAWLRSDDWMPLADHPGGGAHVYASRWDRDGVPLWAIVNRGDAYEGPWLVAEQPAGLQWVELTTGVPLDVTKADDGRTVVSGRLPAGGVAAVLATNDQVAGGRSVLAGDSTFAARAAVRMPARTAFHPAPPPGAVAVEGGWHELTVHYRVRETGLYGEVPFVDEWKPLPPRLHATGTMQRSVYVPPFAIALMEVTNGEFLQFIEATSYRPARPERFLAHWAAGRATAGEEHSSVTHVDLADARAFAAWVRMRLPTEDEWQVAASLGLIQRGAPLVWNLTESEHTDGRTRFCIVKGGSGFRPDGSNWYFDGGARPPEFSAKLLLAGSGVNRSPSIGFRVACDLPGSSTS